MMPNELAEYLGVAFEKFSSIYGLVVPGFLLGAWYFARDFLKKRFGEKFDKFRHYALLIYPYIVLALIGFMAWRDEHGRFVAEITKSEAESQKILIAIECRLTPFPTTPPETGNIQFLNIGMPNDGEQGLAEKFTQAGDKTWAWPATWATYRCDVTNASTRPLSNVQMNFAIKYIGLYPNADENGKFVDAKVPNDKRSVRIPLITAGGYFSFYAASFDRARAIVELPEVAWVDAGNGKRQEVKLLIGRWRDMLLEPPQQEK